MKALAEPTGCATRWLLGVNRLLNHYRPPHAKKRWWIVAFLRDALGLLDALLEKDGPNGSGLPEHFSLVAIRTASHRFLW